MIAASAVPIRACRSEAVVMPAFPGDVASLLSAADPAAHDRAWATFVRQHSDVLLRVARAMGGGHDATMDRYAFVLDALRREDCKRLRAYEPEGRGAFDTWLTVVARRLCLDHHRQRYGRAQSNGREAEEERATRRYLTDLIGDELGLEQLEGDAGAVPDVEVERTEQRAALEAALAHLDVSDRLVLRLRFEDALSVPEIARLIGVDSPFKVYRQLDRILAAVRKHLEAAGIHDASG
jgi:RNA polymerase sigma factor (sigma-70 family)